MGVQCANDIHYRHTRIVIEPEKSFFERHWLALSLGAAAIIGATYYIMTVESPRVDNAVTTGRSSLPNLV